jgi:hypothetical protein
VKTAHALTREQRTAVHEILTAGRARLRAADSPAEPVATRLLAEWDSHIKWKPADPQRRRGAGPADDDPGTSELATRRRY